MATLDDARNAGKTALGRLFALMNAALDAHDKAGQKALLARIQLLTDKLDALDDAAIAADDARINALNMQLNGVTDAATASMADLTKIRSVLDRVTAVANLIDSLVGLVAKVAGG